MEDSDDTKGSSDDMKQDSDDTKEDPEDMKESANERKFLEDLYNMYWKEPIPSKTLNIVQSGVEHPDDDCNLDSPTTIPYIDLPDSRSLDKLMVRKGLRGGLWIPRVLISRRDGGEFGSFGQRGMWPSGNWYAYLPRLCIRSF